MPPAAALLLSALMVAWWCCAAPSPASGGTITTLAGMGASASGYTGDGAAATSAQLSDPRAVAFSLRGDLYLADTDNCVVRKVDAGTQVITTVVGSSPASCGFSGDGQDATAALLDHPQALIFDPSTGDMYIADSSNHRIRMVGSLNNIINTLYGTGTQGYGGDGGNAGSGLVMFNTPSGLAFSPAGEMHIADTANSVIRKIDALGDITTVCGNGTNNYTGDGAAATSATLGRPRGVAFNAAGDMYVADTDNFVVRVVDHTTQVISSFAGNSTGTYTGDGGLASAATLFYPFCVTVTSSTVYICDTINSVIRAVDLSTSLISTFAGQGAGGFGSGSFSGDGGSPTSASLQYPSLVVISPAGDMVVADYGNNAISQITMNQAPPRPPPPLPPPPSPPPPPPPPPVAASAVISTVAGTASTAGFSGDGSLATSAKLHSPHTVCVNAAGAIYVTDPENNRVRLISTSGYISTVAGNGSVGYSGDGGAATAATFDGPYGMALDVSGGFYVADFNTQVIRQITAGGVISTIAGTAHTSGHCSKVQQPLQPCGQFQHWRHLHRRQLEPCHTQDQRFYRLHLNRGGDWKRRVQWRRRPGHVRTAAEPKRHCAPPLLRRHLHRRQTKSACPHGGCHRRHLHVCGHRHRRLYRRFGSSLLGNT